MCGFSPRTVVPILCLLCLPALSQESTVAHVCVAQLRSGVNTVSVTEARDRLVKALNQQKPDKKSHLSARAVPLEFPWGAKTIEEAKEKSCEFVLSTRLTNLMTSSAPAHSSSLGTDSVPVFDAIVEYQLIRTLDGTVFATGTMRAEDSASLGDAVFAALAHVVPKVLPEIAKNSSPPHTESGAGNQAGAVAPQPTEATTFTANPCAWLPSNIPHAAAVAGVCEYAMSLPQKMPNFVCDQDASRYRGKNTVPFDLVTASVRYENGSESFENIKVNGKLTPAAMTQMAGLWSTGEFGSDLRSIFDLRNQTLFEFAREGTWEQHTAWIFTYKIAKQNDPLWRLHDANGVLAPPYQGELWVDQKTGELLRFGSTATDIPPSFGMAGASLQIDYASVAFADGSAFVLPSNFTVTTEYRGEEATRNVVQFRSCHKFRAKSRMVLNVPALAGAATEAASDSSAESTERELEESNKIYAILRDEAVREDAALLELEAKAESEAATVAAIRNLSALEQRGKRNADEEVARAESAAAAAKESLTMIRVQVNLVTVSVVLRDSKGNANGNLHQQDFQLFDNGKPQVIKTFSVESAGSLAEEAKSSAKTSAGNVGIAAAGETRAATRGVAYVFDDIHTGFGDLVQARDAAARHIAALRPEDRMAVFTTSGTIGLDFTADRDKLRQAIASLGSHPTPHGALCPPMTEYMADLIVNHDDLEALGAATKDAANCAFGGMANTRPELTRAEQMAKTTALEVLNAGSAANQRSLNALRQAVARTAAAPGSRSIVLVSPGFLTLTPETRQAVMDLVDQALRANIVIHSLDVRGLVTPGQAPNMSHPANSVQRVGMDRDEALAQNDVMMQLAYGTGGTFFHNNNDVNEGFRRTADAPEYMYILGFSPQKLDGKFHKLTVKLAVAQKFTLQSRQGYYAAKPAAQ